MKKIVTLLFCIVYFTNAMAQESKFVGTWKGVYNPCFARGEDWIIVIRITQEGKNYQVRIKQCEKKDSTNWHYFDVCCYDIHEVGSSSLQWYSKNSSTGITDEDRNLGGVCGIYKSPSYVKYSAGVLYYKTNYWRDCQIVDKYGNVVKSISEKNNPGLIDEAILYKEENNW